MDALISKDDLTDEELEQPELVDRLKREGIHPLAPTMSDLVKRLYVPED
ncbi:hypothetical protein [Paenibacillus sp. NPDC058174]